MPHLQRTVEDQIKMLILENRFEMTSRAAASKQDWHRCQHTGTTSSQYYDQKAK